MSKTLLIQSSARFEGSVTRRLATDLALRLDADPVVRDLAVDALPQIDEAWVGANFTDAEARTDAQRETLALSDALVAELKAADTLVIGLPVYNFSAPAALKAWIDLVMRARVTFAYGENGPEGLLHGKTAYLVVASGGTEAMSAIDFATPYLKHVLGWMGITDVRIVHADKQAVDGADAAYARAEAQIAELTAA